MISTQPDGVQAELQRKTGKKNFSVQTSKDDWGLSPELSVTTAATFIFCLI